MSSLYSSSCFDETSPVEIIIGTTAINRSDLHRENMSEWIRYIKQADPSKYNIHWIVNIDYIEALGESPQTTREYIQQAAEGVSLDVILPPNNKDGSPVPGSFLNACKTIGTRIESHVDTNHINPRNVLIVWLEDDWKLNPNNIPIQNIIETYIADMTYVNFSYIRNNYIHALAPCIMNYTIFRRFHLSAWSAQVDVIDPEHCVGKLVLDQYGKYEHIQSITVINKYKTPKMINAKNKSFFTQPMLAPESSYYTYDTDYPDHFEKTIIDGKYKDSAQIRAFIKGTPTFVRITSTMCIDGCNYGRKFMALRNIKKTGVQTQANVNFYDLGSEKS